MEIERKYLPRFLPPDWEQNSRSELEQAYLCIDPVLRVRKEDDSFYLTYKGKGFLAREEYNLPLNREAYEHLKTKADGLILTKTRYRIPLAGSLIAELDCFHGDFEGLTLIEVEFPDQKSAENFLPPDWFGREVTWEKAYSNSFLSRQRRKTSS
ncbi:MAG: CYTH domain-containing protein [Lachnospiraceae bacterium]|nr:CYTH domain-containing protein [Lachnospiraceae bacterium]